MTPTIPIAPLSRFLAAASVVLAGAFAVAAPPAFTIRPAGDEDAFVGSIYKAVVVAEAEPAARIEVLEPAGARFEDDTLKYLPPGRSGTSFQVRLRAVNPDGQAEARWLVTLVEPLSLEFASEGEYTASFTERFEQVPASQLAGLGHEVAGDVLALTIPATGRALTENLDSWCDYDRTPRWWARPKVFGAFELEARVDFEAPPRVADDGYHAGLVLDRGDRDLTLLGLIRDDVEAERTCQWDRDRFALLPSPFSGAASGEVILRIVVNGKRQSFEASGSDGLSWVVLGEIESPRPPILGVGLAVKTWGSQSSFRLNCRHLRYRGLPPEEPRFHGTPDSDFPDFAFPGGPYTVALPVLSDLPAALSVLEPAGAAIDSLGYLSYPVLTPPGTIFPVRVRAASAAGAAEKSWNVHVMGAASHEFRARAEFADGFFDPGNDSSARKGEVLAAAADDRLVISLPDAFPEDFDSWCGFDRTPRWLHRARVTGTYAAETEMSFALPPEDLREGYHAGLAIDRGPADLAILGAIRNGVQYERNCLKDGEYPGYHFPEHWSDPRARIHLRAEGRGGEQLLLARRPGDATWTTVERIRGMRPRPHGIGLALKDWGSASAYAVGFERFDYGLPGVAIAQAPASATVLRGDAYGAVVAARGVRPLHALAEAPAGASIDPLTGRIAWTVPADAPCGAVFRFEARVLCGLEEASAAWSLTVGSNEPAVGIAAFAPSSASYLGKTAFTVRGSNFTTATDVVIDGVRIRPRFVDATTLEGTLPPHAPTEVPLAAAVEDPCRGRAVLPGALAYEGPLAVTAVEPASGFEGARVTVTVRGKGFTPATRIRIGGADLVAPAFVDASAIGGRAPALSPGAYDAVASDITVGGQAVSAVLARAYTVVGRVGIDSFAPSEVSYLGRTPFEVKGRNFTAGTALAIGGEPVAAQLVDDRTLRGTAPPRAVTTLALPVQVDDPDGGSSVLEAAVSYVGPFQVTAVSPPSMAEGAAVEVAVSGLGFTPETEIRIGGTPLAGRVFDGARRIRGRIGGLAAGKHDVAAGDRDGAGQAVTAALPRAFEVIGAPAVTAVAPYHLSHRGTTPVEVRGKNFTPEMKLLFDGGGEVAEMAFEILSPTLARGLAPAHRSGPVDVAARTAGAPEGRLAGAARYDTPDRFGPDEIEATLVDGAAAFRWVNRLPYAQIHVYREGKLLKTLPGSATLFEDEVPVLESAAEYVLAAAAADGSFALVHFKTIKPNCPAPALPVADRGPKDFALRAGHLPFQAGAGGGAAGNAVAINAAKFTPVAVGDGNGLFQGEADLEQFLIGPNELVTGFILFEPAKKLRIEVHGAKVLGGDVSLRLLLEGASPGLSEARELELPDPLVDPTHGWIDLTYNTENPPPPPGSPPPEPRDRPLPPHPPIPAGMYRARLYAVGGKSGEPHYSISSDFSIDQIPVPGVGCPPYPLIRVADTTGKNSNPVIEGIEQVGEATPVDPPTGTPWDQPPPVLAKLRAITSDPDVPADPIHEYWWEVPNSMEVKKLVTAARETTMTFPGYGFYEVTLTVRDQRCGFAIRTLPVRIAPPCIPPPAGEAGPNFTDPFPRPSTLHFVANLPGELHAFPTKIPMTFTFFAVDKDCAGTALTQSVQLGLFSLASTTSPIKLTDGTEARAQACLVGIQAKEKACWKLYEGQMPAGKDFERDGRFWEATFPDLRLLPETPFPVFYLKARGSPYPESTGTGPAGTEGWGHWRDLRLYDAQKQSIKYANQVRVAHKPPFLKLSHTHGTGSYEPKTQSYAFHVDMAPPGESGVGFLPPTPPFALLIVGAVFPSLKNGIASVHQKASLSYREGIWSLDRLEGGVEGVVLNGKVSGATDLLQPQGKGLPGGGGQGFDPTKLSYDHSETRTLFEDSHSWPVFNAPIWSGPIGPIYVTVIASLSIGVALSVESDLELHLRGFPAPGDEPYCADFRLTPHARIAADASIRSDIFFGILSLRGGVTLGPTFDMPFHLGANSQGRVGPEAALKLGFDIDLWFKGCVDLKLKELCKDISWPLYNGTLLELGSVSTNACPGGGGFAAEQLVGGGGGLIDFVGGQLNSPERQLSVASSPDGNRQIAVGIFNEFFPSPAKETYQLGSFLRVKGKGWQEPVYALEVGYLGPSVPGTGLQSDPKAVFLDNDRVLVAWTQDYSWEDPSLPQDPSAAVSPDIFNRVSRRYEIVYRVGLWKVGLPGKPGLSWIDWGPVARLTDDPESGLRADGNVSLAVVPGEGAVWAAWVRYETPDMLVPLNPPQTNPCLPPDPQKNPPQTSRVNLKATGIFARKIAGGAPSGPLVPVSPPNGLIDIEPEVAVSPEGEVFIVWVNDPNPAHEELYTSNVGRNLHASRLLGSAFTPPAPVLKDVSALPAILEPSLALVGKGKGLLVFTALPQNAAPCDTGIGNLRLLHVVRLTGGAAAPAWSDPVLVHTQCSTPVFVGWITKITFATPVEGSEDLISPIALVVNGLGSGPIGPSQGSLFSITVDPETLETGPLSPITQDGNLHQDFDAVMTSAGELVTVSQFLALSPGGGGLAAGRGGAASEVSYIGDLRLEAAPAAADPAITACRVSDPHAGPGSSVRASVTVTNRGLALTPVDAGGRSLLGLSLHYSGEAGRRLVQSAEIPPLLPGEDAQLELDLTLPREPVLLEVEVDEVEGERNPADNLRVCPLGARPPGGLACSVVEREEGPAVLVRWEGSGFRDSALVYRDGCLLAEVPAASTSYLDAGAGLLAFGSPDGSREYSVRFRLDRSLSVKASCQVQVPIGGDGARFRRGDVDGSNEVDISDAIALLGYLYLGAREPACPDAADADDNGRLEITDPIRALGFLFLGRDPPPAPGPRVCGGDPSADGLGACGGTCTP